MSKTFLEVFPTLKVDKGYEGLLEKAEVTKISANHDKSHIRIYLHAERLIPKKIIWYLEHEIKNQLFATKDVFIKIIGLSPHPAKDILCSGLRTHLSHKTFVFNLNNNP